MPSDPSGGSSKNVLVVEDEMVLRMRAVDIVEDAGHVEIDWSIDDDLQRLQLTWTEKGGPAVSTPTRRSFGTRMMESLGQQLHGQVKLDYRPTGFVYMLTAPLSSLT
jgi:two-component sensor histidine kinase